MEARVAFGTLLEWTRVCAEQYRRIVDSVGWQRLVREGDVSFDGDRNAGRLIAVKSWPTRAAFKAFYARELLPALAEIGAQPPAVTTWEIPDFSPRARRGLSLEVRYGPWLDLHARSAALLWWKN